MTEIKSAADIKKVRRLVLDAQGLGHNQPFGKSHKGALAAIEHLGYIQLDSISFGYNNDYAWQKHVLEEMVRDYNTFQSDELKVNEGMIHWNVGSLHVYSRHFKHIK